MKRIAISLALILSALPLTACLDDSPTDQGPDDPSSEGQPTQAPTDQPGGVTGDIDPGSPKPIVPKGFGNDGTIDPSNPQNQQQPTDVKGKTRCCVTIRGGVQPLSVGGVK